MSFRHLEDDATADVAIEVLSPSLAGLCQDAVDAALNVMIEDLGSIRRNITRDLRIESTNHEMLLYELLEEIIFLKDSEQLLLRLERPTVTVESNRVVLQAKAFGESIDPIRHSQLADVKAITMHRFSVGKQAAHTEPGWRAYFVVDV